MPKQMNVRSDGKDLTFKPGKEGSLTYYSQPSTTLNFNLKKRSRVIVDPNLKKKRSRLLPALVGSNRG